MFYTNKIYLENISKETSLQEVFPKEVAYLQTTTQKYLQYFTNKCCEKNFIIEEEFFGNPPHIVIKEIFKG